MNVLKRTWTVTLLCVGFMTVACTSTPEEGSGADSESESETEAASDGSTGAPTTTSGTTTEGASGSESDATTGEPTTGTTTEDPTTEDPTTQDPTTEDPTTEDPTDATTEDPTDATTEDPTDATTEDPTDATTDDATTEDPTGDNLCDQLYVDEIGAEDAELTGDWDLVMSQEQGEGMTAYWPFGAQDGTATWSYDVPCEDAWHVWVRMFDEGDEDTTFVQVDGEPQGWALAEVDCTDNGDGYRWKELNWRAPEDPACVYVMDPWVQNWAVGVHEVAFRHHDSKAISRLIFTNDPDFVP